MTYYPIKRGDTRPSPLAQLLDGAGNAVDLTGAAVRFKARLNDGAPLKIDAAAVVVAPATDGWVRYDPTLADTDTAAEYLAEWQVTFADGSIVTWPGEGHDTFAVAADLDAPVSTGGTGYATRAEARAAGAQGTDAELDTALASARTRIDRFTRQSWAPAVATVAADVSGKGVVLLPRQIDEREPTTVRYVGSSVALPTTSYQVTSSRVLGHVDAIWLGAGGGDILVLGAEPYNGGWRNLQPRTGKVEITGTFGTGDTPQEVRAAAAMIAAAITQGGGLATGGTAAPDTDDEGNVVTITTGGDDEPPSGDGRTTGVPAADVLLRSLTRRPVRIN